MAKKANPAGAKTATGKKSSSSQKVPARKPAKARSSSGKSKTGDFDAVDALLNLLKSPLVADLLAVGAAAAMAAITEARYSRRTGADAQSTKMMKAAGKAAAAAIGRRLATEFEEIRSVSKTAKERAEA